MLDAYVVNVLDEVAGSELAVANAYRDRVVADGGADLLLYLPLDANYGLTDQSGNGRNGTAAGGVTIGAIAGPGDGLPSATDFDGVDDRVTTTYNPFTNATVRTYEGWAWRDDNLANHNLFSSDVGATAPFLQIPSGGNNVTFDPDNGTAGGVVTWAAAWPGSAQWVHWMLIFSESLDSATLYINGSLVSVQAATQAYNASPGNIEIGCRGTNSAPFNGRQAHVAVYNDNQSAFASSHAAAAPYAALAGNTAITVLDLTDFNLDPEGGSLKLDDGTNNETATYTAPSGSTGTLNLGAGLANSYLPGSKVSVLVYDELVVERWADLREPDGEDLLRALVPHHLRPLIPLGSRDEDAGQSEQVRADFDVEDLVVTDVLGKPVTGVELDAAGSSTSLAKDQVRWVRRSDGAVIASIVGYEIPTEDGVFATARASTSTHFATSGLEVVASGTSASFGSLRMQTKEGQTPEATVEVSNSSGSSTLVATILNGDGTSDFLLDNAWLDWSPTLTGWSANPTGNVYRYKQMGKMVVAVIRQTVSGTSNSTSTSITAPVLAATGTNYQWESQAAGIDNGVLLTTPSRASINSGTQTITFGKDYSTNSGGWTASGGKRIASCTLIYEAA